MKLHLAKHTLLLGLIILTGLFLRLYNLSSIPRGLHGDEASIGYNAFSLLKTGKDQDGHPYPIAIDQFGDFRPPGYHYLDIPFVAALGLTHLAVRLPSALFGVAMIIMFYFLVRELFENKWLATAGAALLTIFPWHIIISRATSEGIIAGFFVLLGAYLTLRYVKHRDPSILMLLLATLSFGISFLFYHAARLFVPLLFPFLFLLAATEKRKRTKRIIWLGIAGAALLGALLFLFTAARGVNRPLDISIFRIPGVATLANQQIAQDGPGQPIFIGRALHNKLFNYSRVFLSSYFAHLSSEFFFVSTGLPIRYRVPWSSNLYLATLPLLVYGLAVLLTDAVKKKNLLLLLPIVWTLLGAVPAGLTFEDLPNIQRASLMIPGLVIIMVVGAYELLVALKGIRAKKLIIGIFLLIFAHNVISFFHNYFQHSKTNEPWHRSAAAPDLLFSLQELTGGKTKVYMTSQGNNNFIHYLFYFRVDPAQFQAAGSPKEYDGLTYGNLTYISHQCPAKNAPIDLDAFYVDQFICDEVPYAQTIKVINHPDGSGAYRILKLIPEEVKKAGLTISNPR